MKPYWITVEPQSRPTLLSLGAGITAISEADAKALFQVAFGPDFQITKVEPIADMRDLEQNHVVPNMGNWFKRGVWYPLGYEHTSNISPEIAAMVAESQETVKNAEEVLKRFELWRTKYNKLS